MMMLIIWLVKSKINCLFFNPISKLIYSCFAYYNFIKMIIGTQLWMPIKSCVSLTILKLINTFVKKEHIKFEIIDFRKLV